jgi:hypothetical protein
MLAVLPHLRRMKTLGLMSIRHLRTGANALPPRPPHMVMAPHSLAPCRRAHPAQVCRASWAHPSRMPQSLPGGLLLPYATSVAAACVLVLCRP